MADTETAARRPEHDGKSAVTRDLSPKAAKRHRKGKEPPRHVTKGDEGDRQYDDDVATRPYIMDTPPGPALVLGNPENVGPPVDPAQRIPTAGMIARLNEPGAYEG